MRTYLDHNATSPMRPEARAAMIAALELAGNPSSVHSEGRAAKAVIETARAQVAALVNARPEQIVFTSGGTEANNTALNPLAVQPVGIVADQAYEQEAEFDRYVEDDWRLLFLSAIEHASVRECRRNEPDEPNILPVTAGGQLDLTAAEAEIERVFDHVNRVQAEGKPLFLAALMHANNETGVVQPVAEFADIIHSRNGLFHCDAVQSAGKLPLDFAAIGADFMSLSAHKLGGPKGIGALVVARQDSILIEPLISGGGQERRMRAGTENVAGIAGFGAAAEAAGRDLSRFAELAVLRNEIEAELCAKTPAAFVVGAGAERLANTSCIIAPGMTADAMLIGLDLDGVAISSGSACSSGKVGRSHVLAAMGISEDLARSAVRISLGWNTTRADIAAFLGAWSRLSERRARKKAAA